MASRYPVLFVLLAFLSGTADGQTFRPGYLDPVPVLEAAEKAIGVDKLRCVTISGR